MKLKYKHIITITKLQNILPINIVTNKEKINNNNLSINFFLFLNYFLKRTNFFIYIENKFFHLYLKNIINKKYFFLINTK